MDQAVTGFGPHPARYIGRGLRPHDRRFTPGGYRDGDNSYELRVNASGRGECPHPLAPSPSALAERGRYFSGRNGPGGKHGTASGHESAWRRRSCRAVPRRAARRVPAPAGPVAGQIPHAAKDFPFDTSPSQSALGEGNDVERERRIRNSSTRIRIRSSCRMTVPASARPASPAACRNPA